MQTETGYQLSTSVTEGIVEIVIIGDLTVKIADKLLAELFTIIRGKNAEAVLYDVRAVNRTHNLGEAYFFFRNKFIPEYAAGFSAVVDLPENANFGSFCETTAANAGLSFKWFTDISDARAWLKAQRMRQQDPIIY